MLTFPLILAVITAGALGGVHCIGMCGGLSVLLESEDQRVLQTSINSKVIPIQGFEKRTPGILNKSQISRHAGRLLVYALIGGIMGGLGAIGMQFRPIVPLQQILYIFGNLALIILAIRLLEIKLSLPASDFLHGWLLKLMDYTSSKLHMASRHPFLSGMAWGMMPCGIIYGVAPFALLSGQAWSGAVLMLMFGLAALPYLLFASALKNVGKNNFGIFLRKTGGLVLLVIATFGLWHYDMKDMPAFLCVTPML